MACPAVTFCPAVGNYSIPSGEQRLFAEAWDGQRWAVEPTPQPKGEFLGSLDAIACISTAACMAVGGYSNETSANQYPIAERWNGSRWALLSQPAALGQLNGVACPSAADCLAVGSNVSHVIAAHWDGTRWSAILAPTPTGAQSAQLNAVA